MFVHHFFIFIYLLYYYCIVNEKLHACLSILLVFSIIFSVRPIIIHNKIFNIGIRYLQFLHILLQHYICMHVNLNSLINRVNNLIRYLRKKKLQDGFYCIQKLIIIFIFFKFFNKSSHCSRYHYTSNSSKCSNIFYLYYQYSFAI